MNSRHTIYCDEEKVALDEGCIEMWRQGKLLNACGEKDSLLQSSHSLLVSPDPWWHDFLICLHLWTMYMYTSVKVLHGAVALVCMHTMHLNHYWINHYTIYRYMHTVHKTCLAFFHLCYAIELCTQPCYKGLGHAKCCRPLCTPDWSLLHFPRP